MTEMNNFYFKEMEKFPLLSQEEEKSLAAKAFSGDKSAQKKLVEANLRFVVKIANKYKGYMEVEDLISEGNLGLMHAAEKFDPSNGNRFSTYAIWWVKAFIQKAIRETSTGIRFPASKYREMKEAKWQIASLDKAVKAGDDDETTLMSFIKDDRTADPEEEYLEKEFLNQMHTMINTLKPYEKTILIKRFGLYGNKPMSLSQVGTLTGFSKERVRQIEKKALEELKANMDCLMMGYDTLAA